MPKIKKEPVKKAPKKSNVTKAIKELNSERGGGWVSDKKTRGAINTKTGEKISRRQLEKNYGLLKRQGYSGFEDKAKKRKTSGLKGFKTLQSFPSFQERTFNSRAEMFKFLESYKNRNDFIFRVKLSGHTPAEKYKQDEDKNSDGLEHAYAEQLAYMSAEDTMETYTPEIAERKFSEVVAWTLTARRNIYK